MCEGVLVQARILLLIRCVTLDSDDDDGDDNDKSQLYWLFIMSGTVLSTLYPLSHLIFTTLSLAPFFSWGHRGPEVLSDFPRSFHKLRTWDLSKVCHIADPKLLTTLHFIPPLGLSFQSAKWGIRPFLISAISSSSEALGWDDSSCNPLAAKQYLVFY